MGFKAIASRNGFCHFLGSKIAKKSCQLIKKKYLGKKMFSQAVTLIGFSSPSRKRRCHHCGTARKPHTVKKIEEERGAQKLAFYKNSETEAISIKNIAFVVQSRAARAVILSQTTNLPKNLLKKMI
jgi:hypothetical protein